jgi:hypothetical protein
VIGNRNGEGEKFLAIERGLFEERHEFWKMLKRENPKWSMEKFKEFKDEL